MEVPPAARKPVDLMLRALPAATPGVHYLTVRLIRRDGTIELEQATAVEHLGRRGRLVIPASEDSFVTNRYPDLNKGNATLLVVNGGEDELGDVDHTLAYLKFHLDVPGRPTALRLRLTNAGDPTGDAGRICLVEAPWRRAHHLCQSACAGQDPGPHRAGGGGPGRRVPSRREPGRPQRAEPGTRSDQLTAWITFPGKGASRRSWWSSISRLPNSRPIITAGPSTIPRLAITRLTRWIFRRLLLPASLVLCIGAGWLGLRLYQARREANAVEAIQAAGGQVIYDFQRGQSLSGPARPQAFPSPRAAEVAGRALLRPRAGGGIRFPAHRRRRDAPLSQLSELRELGLIRTRVRGPGLSFLKTLPRLETLYLDGTPLDDAAWESLSSLAGLRRLYLNQTPIGDAGVTCLKGLTRSVG